MGRKNKFKSALKHLTSLRGGIHTRRREKVTLPLPKDMSIIAACPTARFPFFLFPNRN
jgi:hypothetical protein